MALEFDNILRRLFRKDTPYQSNLNYQFSADGRGGSDSERKLEAIRLPDLKGKRFLDLGCNAGFFCVHARDTGASEVLGLDKSEKVIAMARELHPDLRFLDTGWDVFPEGEFDVVICLSAIHYASDAVKLANDIHSHLSDNGLFVLEGGLWGAGGELWSDTLLPVWREVGDRVRHLGRGYVERHLLTSYSWNLLGRSIDQGGDLLERYVIHARPSDLRPRATSHRLCLLEYARGIAISSSVISEKQPAYAYVKAIGSLTEIASVNLENVLRDDAMFNAFIADLVYALNGARELVTQPTMTESFLARCRQALEAKGVTLTW